MPLYITAYLAGILTILAPCVLPLLPIILGSGADKRDFRKLLITPISLGVFIFLFTILLKATTSFINIPTTFWQYLSGTLIILFGISSIWPMLWTRFAARTKIQSNSDKLLEKTNLSNGWLQPILLGFALGPVFSSCSPTYFVILGLMLSNQWTEGIIALTFYCLGLVMVMVLIAWLGNKLVKKLRWAANPDGWFKKVIGVLFVVVGLSILLGWDKAAETWLITNGFADWMVELESKLDNL